MVVAGDTMTPGVADLWQPPAAFSYETLPIEQATALQQSAERIRSLGRQQTEAIVEIGRELISAKERLPHGEFTAWLDAEFGMSDRTALNYMHLANWGQDKPEIISVLPPTALYLLAAPSTPEPAKDEIVKRIRCGDIVRADDVKRVVCAAKEKITEAKRAERRERRRAELSPERRKADDELEERCRKQAQREEAQRERKARERAERCERAAVMLRERLGEDLAAFLELVAPKNSSLLLGWSSCDEQTRDRNARDLGRATRHSISVAPDGTSRVAPGQEEYITGFCSITLPSGLEIDDIAVHLRGDRAWASLPARPMLDAEGRQVMRDGRPQYVSMIRWQSRDLADRFSTAVVELVRNTHPDAFEEGGAG